MALWLLCRLDGCEVRLLQKSFGGNWRYLSDSCYLCLTFRAVLATYGGTCFSLMGWETCVPFFLLSDTFGKTGSL